MIRTRGLCEAGIDDALAARAVHVNLPGLQRVSLGMKRVAKIEGEVVVVEYGSLLGH